jgi:hypothetical protein
VKVAKHESARNKRPSKEEQRAGMQACVLVSRKTHFALSLNLPVGVLVGQGLCSLHVARLFSLRASEEEMRCAKGYPTRTIPTQARLYASAIEEAGV